MLLIIFMPFYLKRRGFNFIRLGFGMLAIVLMVLFSDIFFSEIQKRMDGLSLKLSRQGESSFTVADKLTIYNTNIVMGTLSRFFGAPEAGKEALRMCIKGSHLRRWSSDFPVKSPKVVANLKSWGYALKQSYKTKNCVELPNRYVSWKNYDTDRRVAFALNPAVLTTRAFPEGGRWRVECCATVECKYSKNKKIKLLQVKGKPFYLDEGLFWVLQKYKWLHPYTAEWSWTIRTDDKRLK